MDQTPTIFISYRRSDSQSEAGRIYDALRLEFGDSAVFMDVHNIKGGEDFVQEMNEDARNARVFLPVIGSQWLTVEENGRRRLDDPADFVRQEVQAALDHELTIIPVLVKNASFPKVDDLPDTLKSLATRNALLVRHDPDFQSDVRKLIELVDESLTQVTSGQSRPYRPVGAEATRFAAVRQHFHDAADDLERLLLSAINQITAMRIVVESHQALAEVRKEPHPANTRLRSDERRGLYHMDAAVDGPPFTPRMLGNLTGKGRLEDASPALRREIDMALCLSDQLHIALEVVPKAVWTYYTSAREFIYIHPWRHSSQKHYLMADLLALEFFTLGLPQNNPKREMFWTRPYVDGFGEGMMVTVGAPIYEGDEFRGTVAIDLSTALLASFMDRFMRDNPVGRAQPFLLNAQGDLLAHPYLTGDERDGVLSYSRALPPELQGLSLDELIAGEPGDAVVIGDHIAFHEDVRQTPWKLVYVQPRR